MATEFRFSNNMIARQRPENGAWALVTADGFFLYSRTERAFVVPVEPTDEHLADTSFTLSEVLKLVPTLGAL